VAQLKRLDEASLQREAVAAVLPQPSLDAPAPAAVVDPLLGGTP
jgi:hypothetical protein